ncbi:hypothetical protein KIN20_016952 [Parelaphostrongylus tenuis]|uniref:STAS domain-containing protein n=1 Tax=Parelaphostrongylus tenuis TaxID=148309 RepID=A0AAD5QR41_PARTN|nr:hypothetical protein KIN20_016952 [Parelaphostrongylus tenuis]
MAIHVSLAKIFAKKYQYEIDTNQEFYALGFTSVLSGFFPVIPPASSLSRTAVSVGAGAKSQLSSIPSSLFIFVVVQFSGSWLQSLPMCVLASIIIVALLGMFRNFKQLKRLWSLSKIDFSIWMMAFIGTLVTDVMQGLAIAIVFALFTTVIREQWPRWHILANIPGTSDFRDMERYRHTYFFNNVCVLRFDSPLLFINVQRFRTVVDKLATDWSNTRYCKNVDKKHLIADNQNYKADSPTFSSQNRKKFLIIDCSGFAYVDMMGVQILKEIHEDLRTKDITVSFAAAKAPVRELFEASGLYTAVAKTNFYPTIYDAISYAQMEQSAVSIDDVSLEEKCCSDQATMNTTDESAQDPERSRSVQGGETMRL